MDSTKGNLQPPSFLATRPPFHFSPTCLSVWMVKFSSFPFLNASAAGSGNVRGQASGSRGQGGQFELLSLPFGRNQS